MDSESNTCSFKSGAVSADVLGIVDVPILLYATSFISISFSNLRACFRKTLRHRNQKKIRIKFYYFMWKQCNQPILTIPIWCTHCENFWPISLLAEQQKQQKIDWILKIFWFGKCFNESNHKDHFIDELLLIAIVFLRLIECKKKNNKLMTKKIHSHTLECVSEFICYAICFCDGNLEI